MTTNLQGQDNVSENMIGGRRGKGLGGPWGLGDPEDKHIRKVEFENLINKRMVMVVDALCTDTHKAFKDCFQKNQFTSFMRCRNELKASRACYQSWIDDKRVRDVCTEDYLQDRKKYRATGVFNYRDKAEQEQVLKERAKGFAKQIINTEGS